jgi:hypothetical protein
MIALAIPPPTALGPLAPGKATAATLTQIGNQLGHSKAQ